MLKSRRTTDFRIICLIATCNRPLLLLERALVAIATQTLRPDRIVIVDDADCLATRSGVSAFSATCPIPIDFLRNSRTKGASGAWNSGLDHVARLYTSLADVFICLLDDDDSWDAGYLEQAIETLREGAEVVATPFRRIESNVNNSLHYPPEYLRYEDFLVGNPGVQGSNLIVRLDRLLQAGGFDEALAACTDRDLCIRLARLCPEGYKRTRYVMVNHFACASRSRLSTVESPQRIAGLSAFFAKYGPCMTESQKTAALSRARKFFGYEPTSDRNAPETMVLPRPTSESLATTSIHLVVGLIVDAERIKGVSGLLEDLLELCGEPGVDGMDVLLLENGPLVIPALSLAELAQMFRRRGLSVYLIDRGMLGEAHVAGEISVKDVAEGCRLSIAEARTALQTYLYHLAKRRPGSIAWILDDDMRLTPLVDDGKHIHRRTIPLVPQLQAMRQQGLHIAIGRYTGAAPLPAITTVRVQLLDLLWNLRWLFGLPFEVPLPSSTERCRQLRAGRRDYYYDLSQVETDRLETPFPAQPAFDGETAGEAALRLTRNALRILAGEQIFRPLIIGIDQIGEFRIEAALHRGGNTFVFDIEALADVPNVAPIIEGRATRRSDMIWALLQRTDHGRRVGSVPFAVYHDRSDIVVPQQLNINAIIDDIRGHAIFAALCNFREKLGVDFAQRLEKHTEDRLASLRLSFLRVEGLVAELETWICAEAPPIAAIENLRTLAACVRVHFSSEVFMQITDEVRRVYKSNVDDFVVQLEQTQKTHREQQALSVCIKNQLDQERVKNARAVAAQFSEPGMELAVLGLGSEGVILTDYQHVFKFFDSWNGDQFEAAIVSLQSFVGRWSDARALYPLLALNRTPNGVVLIYSYEYSEPYLGGHGPGLVELLAECHRYGVVCNNIHPKNLRVVGTAVKLIDYGSDIIRVDDELAVGMPFIMMCRRAFLSWRWAHREDLADVMRSALTRADIPELEGFDRFLQAIRETIGVTRPADPVLVRALALRARRLLDYGCGKGEIAVQLAKAGAEVVAYDPDPALRVRLDALSFDGIQCVHTATNALCAGPYDLVICRRVGCLLDDGAFIAMLGDLRRAILPAGRVLLALCHPVYTPRCVTPEATPLSHSGDPEVTFKWKKQIRSTRHLRDEVHRPEHVVRRMVQRAGFRIVGRHERETVDLERFEPASDILVMELEPAEPTDTTLLIKASAMEAETIGVQVRHLVTMLEAPRGFAEILLVLDSRREGFLRQHTAGDLNQLKVKAELLRTQGWIDRVIEAPLSGSAAAVMNCKWMGVETNSTHSASGAQLSAVFSAFETCKTPLLLHADADVLIVRHDLEHDYLDDMCGVLINNPSALTVAFNIASNIDIPYSCSESGRNWRTESRIGLIHLERLSRILPFPGVSGNEQSVSAWHRALDRAVARGDGSSWRGGDHRTFFIHPTNERKTNRDFWFNVMDCIEQGQVPIIQLQKVDWSGSAEDWSLMVRAEPFVFIIAGHDVAPERFRRCLTSVLRQKRTDWGAIVIDDASIPTWSEEIANICKPYQDRITLIRKKERVGLLANTVEAVRNRCCDPETVIITLDADDCLIGDNVLCELHGQYNTGADVTVGSMLRTDKHRSYPVQFLAARASRGGNVWQHLRSFRKRLFDAIPDGELRFDGSYVDCSTDWAFMLPIVEMASDPRHIERPLYLHEPSGPRTAATKANREAVIAQLIARPPFHKKVRK